MIFAEIEAVTSLEVLLRDYRMVTHPNNDYILNAIWARGSTIIASDEKNAIQYIKTNYLCNNDSRDFRWYLSEFLITYLTETTLYTKSFIQELWKFFNDPKLEDNLCAKEYRRIIKSTIYANDWEEEDWVGIPEEDLYMRCKFDDYINMT
ncbi:MAG: hypothetical protein BEN18_02690 [Epulopiscium sp. Nuni2H_MBin001]|nr:MAG: hypothetical protein BEN18_02690 [Epulopiscium sp. Nuni2H_MBin001]